MAGSVANFFASSLIGDVAEQGRKKRLRELGRMAIDFKGVHYPKAVILHAVFFYVRYAVSYRDLEEIMAERGVVVGHCQVVDVASVHA